MDEIEYEIWAAAQLAHGEGIEDGVARIAMILQEQSECATRELERLRAELREMTNDRDSWADQASDRAQDALDLVAAERERCAGLCDVSAAIHWGAWDEHADPADQGAAIEAERLAAEIRGPNGLLNGGRRPSV